MANLEKLRHRVQDERKWIKDHGGNLTAYIARYGSKDDPEHYGDGGEAIYAADVAALLRAETELERAERG